MVLTEEAVKSLELMPVGLLAHEEQEESTDAKQLETIKYTTNSLRKLSYASYYCTGNGGLEEVVPHAIFTEQAVDELDQVTHLEKALAFKKSCAGIALKNANLALATMRTGLSNTDNNVQVADGVVHSTFHDFVVEYCKLEGHTEDRYNQREGLKHMRKPTPVRVQRWLTIISEKNDLILYLQGTGDKYDADEMRRVFYRSMPMKWQDEFTSNGNNDIGTSSLATIVAFMKQQEARARAKVAANKAKQMAGKEENKVSGKRKNNERTWENPKKKGRRPKQTNGDRDSRNGRSNSNDNKGGEMCTRCVHKHLRKHCLYNPNNPKNILGKLAAKAKKESSGNQDGNHSNHITIDCDEGEANHSHMGFQNSENPKQKEKKVRVPRVYDPAFECLKGTKELFAWVALREFSPEKVEELWNQAERKGM